jgi:hypothetical protein
MKLTGEKWSTRRETCPSATLSTTNPTWTDPRSNPASAVGGRRLTAWAMARPNPSYQHYKLSEHFYLRRSHPSLQLATKDRIVEFMDWWNYAPYFKLLRWGSAFEPPFQASAAMSMRSSFFWDITQRRVVVVCRRFVTTFRSHLDLWRWDRYVVLKRRYKNTTQRCIISQKSEGLSTFEVTLTVNIIDLSKPSGNFTYHQV